MACSRNVDHSVCSDDVADLASRFFALFAGHKIVGQQVIKFVHITLKTCTSVHYFHL